MSYYILYGDICIKVALFFWHGSEKSCHARANILNKMVEIKQWLNHITKEKNKGSKIRNEAIGVQKI